MTYYKRGYYQERRDLECPYCKHKFWTQLEKGKRNNLCTCPRCNSTVYIQIDEDAGASYKDLGISPNY